MDTSITPTQQIIASGSGAVLTSLFVTPLDVVKIRMQSQKTYMKCFLYCNGLMDHLCYCSNGNTFNGKWYKRPSAFNGTLHGMLQIARFEGITSLWSGLSPTLVMAIPATVMYFTAYDRIKDYFNSNFSSSTAVYAPLAGAIARAGTVTVISPLELVRTKMQSKRLSHQEIRHAVTSTVKVGGYRSLWMGLGPTLMRDVPFSMVYWSLLELLKKKIQFSSVFLKSFTSGLLAGLTAGIITLPLDVVKTKRQITLGELELLGVNGRKNHSTYQVIRKIIQESGYRGLFVGIIPRCAKIAPACAIMIGSYDLAKHFFGRRNSRRLSTQTPSSPPASSPPSPTNTSAFKSLSTRLNNSNT